MDYTDGKTLLNILKPKKGDPPPFGAIPFDEIIFDRLKSSPDVTTSPDPKVLVLCGPPGCGKSTIKMSLLSKISVEKYINIDPDEIRTILMSLGVRFSDDKTMAGITNAFNKRMSDQAQIQRLNIVFDTTGQNFRAVSDLINGSKAKGYKSYFTVIWASLETCVRRVSSRNQHLIDSGSGRIQMPEEIVRGIYDNFLKGTASTLLLDYPVRPDEVFLYNNNADSVEPQLLYHKVETDGIEGTDFPGFYNMNLTAVSPFITKIEKEGGRRRNKKTKRRNIKTKKRETKRRNIKTKRRETKKR